MNVGEESVLELLEEIEEIVDTSNGVPLTGKIMVDAGEMLEIVQEIRTSLPDEIQQAQWIKNERDRILGEAKSEYEAIINNAQQQAEDLVEHDKIMMEARKRADAMLEKTRDTVRQLKMSTYDYVDGILFDFQEKMDELSKTYFSDFFNQLETTFNGINTTLEENRDEIKEMAYRTSMNLDEKKQGGEAPQDAGGDQAQQPSAEEEEQAAAADEYSDYVYEDEPDDRS
ncbi:MAG: ATP synthase F0 subunit B [Anaerovoracaceae bacterium]|jgi:DNA anti-recombination protein RmuC